MFKLLWNIWFLSLSKIPPFILNWLNEINHLFSVAMMSDRILSKIVKTILFFVNYFARLDTDDIPELEQADADVKEWLTATFAQNNQVSLLIDHQSSMNHQ